MAAWVHRKCWDFAAYQRYRKHVMHTAPKYRNHTFDCADLSMLLLIEFACSEGLPLTLWDSSLVRYPSKADHQVPSAGIRTTWWNTKHEYVDAVTRRIGAESLYWYNTVVNHRGPQPGDLMLKADHAALVYMVYPPGARHPLTGSTRVPPFPGPEKAAKELRQTEYFRQVPGPPRLRPNGVDEDRHFDYLNHRGFGKTAAEVIYFAKEGEMLAEGFEFRMYAPQVLKDPERYSLEDSSPACGP